MIRKYDSTGVQYRQQETENRYGVSQSSITPLSMNFFMLVTHLATISTILRIMSSTDDLQGKDARRGGISEVGF